MSLRRSTLSIPQVATASTATLTYAETALFDLMLNLNSSFLMEMCQFTAREYRRYRNFF